MSKILKNRKVVITTGPTYEPIDPVRYLSNYSSGKQGFAIAEELVKYDCDIHLVTSIEYPREILGNIKLHHITSADEMFKKVKELLPFAIGIFAAAVADFKPVEFSFHKIKKLTNQEVYNLKLIKNPDIVAYISQNYEMRPDLVIGFAAETENLKLNAQKKRVQKECDFILANDVSLNSREIGSELNHIYFIAKEYEELWDEMSKKDVARKLVGKIIEYFENRYPVLS